MRSYATTGMCCEGRKEMQYWIMALAFYSEERSSWGESREEGGIFKVRRRFHRAVRFDQ